MGYLIHVIVSGLRGETFGHVLRVGESKAGIGDLIGRKGWCHDESREV